MVHRVYVNPTMSLNQGDVSKSFFGKPALFMLNVLEAAVKVPRLYFVTLRSVYFTIFTSLALVLHNSVSSPLDQLNHTPWQTVKICCII